MIAYYFYIDLSFDLLFCFDIYDHLRSDLLHVYSFQWRISLGISQSQERADGRGKFSPMFSSHISDLL